MTFDESKENGPHAQLRKLEGTFVGTARTWFEPGKLGDESTVEGTLKLVLGGRFLLHEYRGTLMGNAMEGLAFYGRHLQLDRWEAAWVDSQHNGTAIMFSTGAGERPTFTGSYPAPEGPDWGWRTELLPREDGVVIRHFNVPPGGEAALAVEFDYRRV